MSATQWYWCLTHGRAEQAERRDDPDNALGPYASADAAADWKQTNEARAARWKAEDEAWDGEPAEPDA